MSWFRRRPLQPTSKMLRAIAEHRERKRTGERSDLTGAVYHGACLACVYQKDNDNRAGIEWCLGCKFADFTDRLPDLSRQLPDIRYDRP